MSIKILWEWQSSLNVCCANWKSFVFAFKSTVNISCHVHVHCIDCDMYTYACNTAYCFYSHRKIVKRASSFLIHEQELNRLRRPLLTAPSKTLGFCGWGIPLTSSRVEPTVWVKIGMVVTKIRDTSRSFIVYMYAVRSISNALININTNH